MWYDHFNRGPLEPSGWRFYRIVGEQSRSIRGADAIRFGMTRIGVGTFITMAVRVALWG